jgi:hypothetical protein
LLAKHAAPGRGAADLTPRPERRRRTGRRASRNHTRVGTSEAERSTPPRRSLSAAPSVPRHFVHPTYTAYTGPRDARSEEVPAGRLPRFRPVTPVWVPVGWRHPTGGGQSRQCRLMKEISGRRGASRLLARGRTTHACGDRRARSANCRGPIPPGAGVNPTQVLRTQRFKLTLLRVPGCVRSGGGTT